MGSVEDEEDMLLLKLHNEKSKSGNMLSQRAYQVVDFSSQYGSDNSLSYTAENFLGFSSVYPRSGDHAYSFQLRTYGQWLYILPSYRKMTTILPYGCSVESQDFIEFRVEKRVLPVMLRIYEVYNPGAIVRLLCYCYDAERWVVTWQGEPQIAPPDSSNCFTIEISGIQFLTDYYRIEFHHKHLKYYCEFDGICLYGEHKFPISFPSYNMPRSNFHRTSVKKYVGNSSCNMNDTDNNTKNSTSCFDSLPHEVMHVIISYLDLQCLCSTARVSRLFHKLCYDPVLYKELNLQLYWHQVDMSALKGLESRLTALKKLNLSWCGGQDRINPPYFIEFLESRGQLLTCLKLSCCPFVNNNCLKAVANYCPNLQDLELKCCRAKDLTQTGFKCISQIPNLIFLDLYHTLIDTSSILTIVKSCVKLEHLFLGSCTNISAFNEVARAVARNLKCLKSLDLWRATSLTCLGVNELAEACHDLVELDLGWCRKIDASCGCVRQLITVNRRLKKLILTAIRTVSDVDMNTVAIYCNDIEQLDILGTSEVTVASVLVLLNSCKKLKLLDVSYCDNSVKVAIADMQNQFPAIEIKCSIPSSALEP